MAARALILWTASCAACIGMNSYGAKVDTGEPRQSTDHRASIIPVFDLSQRFLNDGQRARALFAFVQHGSAHVYDLQKAYLLLVFFWIEATRSLFEGVVGKNFDAQTKEGRWCNQFIHDLSACLSLNPNGEGFIGLIPQYRWDLDAALDAVLSAKAESDEEQEQRLRRMCLLFALGAQPKTLGEEESDAKKIYQKLKTWGYEDIAKSKLVYMLSSGFFAPTWPTALAMVAADKWSEKTHAQEAGKFKTKILHERPNTAAVGEQGANASATVTADDLEGERIDEQARQHKTPGKETVEGVSGEKLNKNTHNYKGNKDHESADGAHESSSPAALKNQGRQDLETSQAQSSEQEQKPLNQAGANNSKDPTEKEELSSGQKHLNQGSHSELNENSSSQTLHENEEEADRKKPNTKTVEGEEERPSHTSSSSNHREEDKTSKTEQVSSQGTGRPGPANQKNEETIGNKKMAPRVLHDDFENETIWIDLDEEDAQRWKGSGSQESILVPDEDLRQNKIQKRPSRLQPFSQKTNSSSNMWIDDLEDGQLIPNQNVHFDAKKSPYQNSAKYPRVQVVVDGKEIWAENSVSIRVDPAR